MYLCKEHIVALTVPIKLTGSKASEAPNLIFRPVSISHPNYPYQISTGLNAERDTGVATLACLALTLGHLDRK